MAYGTRRSTIAIILLLLLPIGNQIQANIDLNPLYYSVLFIGIPALILPLTVHVLYIKNFIYFWSFSLEILMYQLNRSSSPNLHGFLLAPIFYMPFSNTLVFIWLASYFYLKLLCNGCNSQYLYI